MSMSLWPVTSSDRQWPHQQSGGSGVFAESPVGLFGHCFWSCGLQGPLSGPFGDENYSICYKCIFCLNKFEWILLFATKNSHQSPSPASFLAILYTQSSSYAKLLSFPNITDEHRMFPYCGTCHIILILPIFLFVSLQEWLTQYPQPLSYLCCP